MKRTLTVLLALLVTGTLSACAWRQKQAEPAPPPDLSGNWAQPSEDDWYQIAQITDDKIEIWWYIPARNIRELYWSGSFTPPADASEPYRWVSSNTYTADELNASYRFHRASREDVKTFTYRDGVISYNVTAGHLRLGYTLERAAEQSAQATNSENP